MKTVFFDVDTQLDFLYPAGALYVPGAEQLLPALSRLTQFAVRHQVQILSTADAHSENDPEFKVWKPHCVIGTTGQRKSAATLAAAAPAVLSAAIEVPHAQIIIEKQTIDCFTNPYLSPLLSSLAADRYVVYGVVSEVCVSCALTGLLHTGARVELVTDAIRHLDSTAYRQMVEKFTASGGALTTSGAAT